MYAPIVGLISTGMGFSHTDNADLRTNSPFSFSMVSLKSHGAKWPRGSIETIFFLSAHCGKGPIFAAGSVFVKSGLATNISRKPLQRGTSMGSGFLSLKDFEKTIVPMIDLDLIASNRKSVVNRIRATVSLWTR
jgi:hypothetical protein